LCFALGAVLFLASAITLSGCGAEQAPVGKGGAAPVDSDQDQRTNAMENFMKNQGKK